MPRLAILLCGLALIGLGLSNLTQYGPMWIIFGALAVVRAGIAYIRRTPTA